jgi:hypothetical protein
VSKSYETKRIPTAKPRRESIEKFEERFWKRVDQSAGPDGCWPWTGHVNTTGYGMVQFGGRGMVATRVAHMLTHRESVEGLVMAHRCDNPICVNPAHLMAVTQQDNMIDMVTKGRHGMHKEKPLPSAP